MRYLLAEAVDGADHVAEGPPLEDGAQVLLTPVHDGVQGGALLEGGSDEVQVVAVLVRELCRLQELTYVYV